VAEAGGFRVQEVIVQNAHGRLYLARDRTGQAVALKELAFVQAPHPEAIEAFEREARLLQQLDDPQIPRFLASFREGEGVDTRLYLAQEYVEGESLLVRLGRHQFAEEEAIEVALQVLSILEYLQSLAPMVFHRDIKPANLIRRPDGRIALVDFGAARDLGPTVGATLVGTFGYMPLEQMGGIVDATTDPYALGATLCHLLGRREPWKFVEDLGAIERLNGSREFLAFLRKLMARQPSERFVSAAEAKRALIRMRQGKRSRSLGMRLGLTHDRWRSRVVLPLVIIAWSLTSALAVLAVRHRRTTRTLPQAPAEMTASGIPAKAVGPPSRHGSLNDGQNVPKELERGIRRVEEGYEIDRASLVVLLGNVPLLSRSARLVPEIRGGKAVGFRLYGIKPGGLFDRLGLQKGDLVLSANRIELTSPQTAWEVFNHLKDAPYISLAIERDGKMMTKHYWIR
jgi:serine/threonine protein kinase